MPSMPHAAYRRSEQWFLLAEEEAGVEIDSVGKRRCRMPVLPTRGGVTLGRRRGQSVKAHAEEKRAEGRD
ncbi:MAG: hypothetical protein H6Q51_1646 [Deltaproteobacteria bacterium]|nr:hypothetical protein [Deltaproteobacteria bacterium]